MSCKCFGEVNKLLATRNGQLVGTIRLDNSPPRALVAVEKRDMVRREKPPFLSANFCPFCGAKYVDAKPSKPKRRSPHVSTEKP